MPPQDNENVTMAEVPTSTTTNDTKSPLNTPTIVDNYINGKFKAPSTPLYKPILSPINNATIGKVAISTKVDVDEAVSSSSKAFESWSMLTMKSRAGIMMKFCMLVKENSRELAEIIVRENGKNITEALADVAKGNETVEYACSLPQLSQGKTLRVSTQVTCQDRRDPMGVVASIVPFNFPFMVPMWTMPIALVMGNTVVLKPSEKVPLTMMRVMGLMREAGVPDGVVNLVQGEREAVESLIDHPDVRAVTFVGSSPVASIVSKRCHSLNKRCTALGGAKNHLIALPDCDIEETARDIVVSAAGCAGQRCMAASVLLVVGNGAPQEKLLKAVVEKANAIRPGTGAGEMGPVITGASLENIRKYIRKSKGEDGAEVLLDGTSWEIEDGNWVGPTILKHTSADDAAVKDEIFGPVLSVYHVSNWAEAIKIENSNPFGNAACIYTTNGAYADWFTSRFRASMLGVNVGIPVPREPFSFGGLYGTLSKYGDMDITGDGAMEFFSNRIKVTSKWTIPNIDQQVSGSGPTDHANFAGTM